MLNQGNKIVFVLLSLLFSCDHPQPKSFEEHLLSQTDSDLRNEVFLNIQDSVKIWSLNKLGLYTFDDQNFSFRIDSIVCFNKGKTRAVSAIHSITLKQSQSDGLIYLLGEKLNGMWYYFRGASIVVPRSLYSSDKLIPLNYSQLHNAAIKNIFSGYLLPNGEINEKFFTELFEGPGWGDLTTQELSDWCFKGKRYTDLKEFYKAVHLCKVKANWMSRDTTQPIIPLPPKDLK